MATGSTSMERITKQQQQQQTGMDNNYSSGQSLTRFCSNIPVKLQDLFIHQPYKSNIYDNSGTEFA